jgi:hypothetical protein
LRFNGRRHREDGPAIECASGRREWWLNGQLQREDGPAPSRRDWRRNGQCHREDGPAVRGPNSLLGLSQESVRQIQNASLKRMRPSLDAAANQKTALRP